MTGTEKDIKELYQAVILDHNKYPVNFGKPKKFDLMIEAHNPLCGDHFEIYFNLSSDKEIIESVHFTGEGCAISKASTSILCKLTNKLEQNDAKILHNEFFDIFDLNKSNTPSKKELKIFSGVKKYPSRVKCAVLSWKALNNFLNNSTDIAKSE